MLAIMTIARFHTVDPHASGAFHVVSRCVRRALLCGRDPVTGRDFSHRKGHIEERIVALAAEFAIGIYAYAVMSNHVHLVVRTAPELTGTWSDLDVLRRWFSVSRRRGDTDASIEQRALAASGNTARIAEYRLRLGNLSWFMRFLNESIARAANAEDDCKGHFWEGRFRCQVLLDDAAVLSAMTYVDLNPVRAKVVTAPEAAEHVSFRRRSDRTREHCDAIEPLAPVAGQGSALGVSEREYLMLVDETGRRLHSDKPGVIDRSLPSIIRRIGLSENAWLLQVQGTQSRYWRAIGMVDALIDKATELHQRWLKGVMFARRLKVA
jgi:REP element-mobilizing transposase RayT